MNIKFTPLNKYDPHYSEVIELYKEAFPEAKYIPVWLLRYKLRKGKIGFDILYAGDIWVGLIYTTKYKDIVFVQFLAISESCRSAGYGSEVLNSLKQLNSGNRIVLNIEPLDKDARNYQQRQKRKAFYSKNGFCSSRYLVKESVEQFEMLIFGGKINQKEIEAMYKDLFGNFLGFLFRPKIRKI